MAFKLLGIAALAVALAAITAGGAQARRKSCSSIRYAGSSYPVRVLTGSVSCARARRTLSHYFRTFDRRFGGWTCFTGHGQDAWAGTCTRGKPGHHLATVRAYNPSG